MRSALAGIPLLTPQWMEACLKEGHLVAPTGRMCVRSLPRKQQVAVNKLDDKEGIPTEQFGVAKFAAAFQKSLLSSSNHFLSGYSVMICGSSGGLIKDLKVLLLQAGASIVSSALVASQRLSDMSAGDSMNGSGGPLVFLCDDSTGDKTCGVSAALLKQVKKFVAAPGDVTKKEKVLCVHFNWLFDSISCTTPMAAAAYEPLAPRTKEVWSITVPESQVAKNSRRIESQVY